MNETGQNRGKEGVWRPQKPFLLTIIKTQIFKTQHWHIVATDPQNKDPFSRLDC